MDTNNFSTKRYKLRDFELLDFRKNRLKEYFVWVSFGQSELIFSARVDQTAGDNQEVCTNGLEGSRVPSLWQRETLEPVNQIVDQKNQMKVCLIGKKTIGRNFAQRKAFFEFSDIQFAVGSGFVKNPHTL